MIKIQGMSREPDMTNRIQFPSIPELKDGMTNTVNRLARKVKFRGRKLRPGPLMNALVLHYLTLPEEEQIAIAATSIERYESLLQSDEPVDDLKSIAAAESPADDEPGGKIAVPIYSRVVQQLDPKRKHKTAKPRG